MTPTEAANTVLLALAVPIAMLVAALGWALYRSLVKLIDEIVKLAVAGVEYREDR